MSTSIILYFPAVLAVKFKFQLNPYIGFENKERIFTKYMQCLEIYFGKRIRNLFFGTRKSGEGRKKEKRKKGRKERREEGRKGGRTGRKKRNKQFD